MNWTKNDREIERAKKPEIRIKDNRIENMMEDAMLNFELIPKLGICMRWAVITRNEEIERDFVVWEWELGI